MDDQDDLLEGKLYPVLSPIPALLSTCRLYSSLPALTGTFSCVMNLYIGSAGDFLAKEEKNRGYEKKQIPIPERLSLLLSKTMTARP